MAREIISFKTLDIRDCVARLIKIGRTPEQANAEVDVMLDINRNSGATKEEVREIDHRVDMVEVKLDLLSDKVDALDSSLSKRIDHLEKKFDTKFSWIISLLLSIIAALIYAMFEYFPVIAKLIELKHANL